MSWYERMNRAVDYIENNLCGDIDLETIAKITFQSAASFQRTFSVVTEMPVSEYIRRRRMSQAAAELQSKDSKVIDVALKYRYDSPEAFARAFKELYGISPSQVYKEKKPLRAYPRISFQMTVKGDVIMDYEPENTAVRVTNLYREHLPAIRFIGKRYTSADLNAEGLLMDRWNEWFQNGWFTFLCSLPGLPGYEGVAHTAYHSGDETEFWIGLMFPEGMPTPDGFDSADLPAGDTAVCWLRGYRETAELFRPDARNMCLTRIREAGYSMKLDFNGEPCKWTFERYHNRRFFVPDDEGRITVDYCVYVVEREGAAEENAAAAEPAPKPQTPAPEVQITAMAPYSTDAESNPLFCALTATFLKLNQVDEATPFFCARNGRFCNHCGDCGEMGKRPNLAKHHLALYHHLLTVSAVGLLWGDPNEAGDYDLKYIRGITPPLLEDRLDFAMKAEGFDYIRLDKLNGERDIFRHVIDSVRSNRPVLMKMDDSPEWRVVTGYDSATGALFGLDAKEHPGCRQAANRTYTEDGLFIAADWFKNLHKAIVVTGKAPKALEFNELIARMTGRLSYPERSTLEAMIPQMIDSITKENARSVAGYLNNTAGYAIEARWHGAECFGSMLRKADDEAAKACLEECMGLFFNTHDVCWQIWGQMNIGPHTNFQLPGNISQLMLDGERQAKLKELFAQIFNNDRVVLEKLKVLQTQ